MSKVHNVEIVQLEEKNFVGVAVTSSYKNIKGIEEARQFFIERKNEIQGKVIENEYVCVHFSNEILFTYIYCMEVSELLTIPDGMVGFTVPHNRYVKVRSKDTEPYSQVNKFIKDNFLESNIKSVSFEVFKFGEEESKYNADIFVPIIV